MISICSRIISAIPPISLPQLPPAWKETAKKIESYVHIGNAAVFGGFLFTLYSGNIWACFAGLAAKLGYHDGNGDLVRWSYCAVPEKVSQIEQPVPCAVDSEQPICVISTDVIEQPDRIFIVQAGSSQNIFDIFNLMIYALADKTSWPRNPANRQPLTEKEFAALLKYFSTDKTKFQDLWKKAENRKGEIYAKFKKKYPKRVELTSLEDNNRTWFHQELANIRYLMFLEDLTEDLRNEILLYSSLQN